MGDCSAWNNLLFYLFNIMDIVSSGANLVGGAINAIAQNRANKQMLSEMQKNRDFNAKEAAIQRDATNPMRQLQMLRLGGMNPAAANASTISQGGSSASAGELGHIQPVTGLGSALQQNELLDAQIENVKADTKGKEADANNKEAQTDWLGKINQSQIELNKSTIHLNEVDADRIATLTPSEKEELNARINNINTDTEKILQSIENLKVDEKLSKERIKEVASQVVLNNSLSRKYKIDADLLCDMFDSLVAKSASEAEFTADEVVIHKSLGHFDINVAEQEEKQSKIETQTAEKQLSYFDLDKTFGYASALIGMFGDVAGALTSFGNMRNGSRMAGAMEKNANARQQNADTKSYDSSVNAIEKTSRADLNFAKSVNEKNKWYDHNSVPDKHRSYKKVSVPRRRKK